ncbi:MAG: preprotein translocase subunit YajC [Actinomycetaceae bacterium]|nr:preprotein translocase subunit YajC [Actinomycetaceae bacterium]MDY5855101.1 preprotein translocase subunit YajC [Arcanobacterium sp.]
MGLELAVILVVMIGLFWWMSRSAKKQQQRMQEQRDAAIVLGATVMTNGGFFGTVVDIDGDAITLESPSGIETVWLRSAIAQAMEIPFAAVSEEEDAQTEATDMPEHDGEDVSLPASGESADESAELVAQEAASAAGAETRQSDEEDEEHDPIASDQVK